MKYYLSICSQFRNEAPYLLEWIEFHRLVGVDHFFLYDHFSTDNCRAVLNDYINNGVVTLIDWRYEPHHDTAQVAAHDHCLAHYREDSQWIAFIDVDEFLFAPQSGSCANMLKAYEGQAGIVVNWQIYGSSGHILKPRGLVIENFTKRAPTDFARNLKGKSIVNPRDAIEANSPHYFRYRDGKLAVTENFEPVENTTVESETARMIMSTIKKVSVAKIRLNHYCVKSFEEFQNKSKTPSQRARYDKEFFEYHDRNDVEDPILHAYLPILKAAVSTRQPRANLIELRGSARLP